MTSMDLVSARLRPAIGDSGWLARGPGVVVWAPVGGDAAAGLLGEFLGAEGASQLLALVGQSLASAQGGHWPPFALLAERDDELVVLVHGPVAVTVFHDGSEEVLRAGDETGSWLSRSLKSVTSLQAGDVPGAEGSDPLSDLRAGVVRAAGFVLGPPATTNGQGPRLAGGEGQDEGPGPGRASQARGPASQARGPARGVTAQSPSADRVVPFDQLTAGVGTAGAGVDVPPAPSPDPGPAAIAAISGAEDGTIIDAPSPLVEGAGRGEPGAPGEDLTVVDAPALAGAGPGPGGATSTLEGANCPRGHFNDPRRSSCRYCGAALATGVPRAQGERPSLGALTWDTGEVSDLGQSALVGRDVASDEAVQAGRVAAVVPGGPNDSMSRVHAEFRPKGWDVFLVDRGSTNGTFIWEEDSRAWQRLVPGEPQAISSGDVLAFGERTATFEA